ncbi:MAG: hypothetical protein V7K89_27285, partial [Nostoc sp.]|uniref:hypothetical protein n=1 Tax=Nostoc sp. TaxID=1180 RepID=UPI002FFBEF79
LADISLTLFILHLVYSYSLICSPILENWYNLRISAGYVFGKVDDRDFSGTRSAGGAYLGFTVKLNDLFDGFGQQKPIARQPQESAMKALVGKLKAAMREIQRREI